MISLGDYKCRRINKSMDNFGLDAMIASLPSNIYYLSEYRSIGQEILNPVQVYFLYNKKNQKKAIVAPLAEVPSIIEAMCDVEVYCYGDFYFAYNDKAIGYENIRKITERNFKLPNEALITAIRGIGIEKGKVGFDESRVNPQTWNRVCSEYTKIKFYPSAALFANIRKIKHPDEIALLEHSAEIAEESIMEIIKNIDIGLSEDEIGKMYINEVVKRKAQPHFNVITIDERSAYSDTVNTEKKIRDGSILRFDVGCIYKGYCSDMARTLVISNYDNRYKEYYNYLLEGEEASIDAIKPGVISEKIFDIAVSTVRKGIPHYKRNHCGHGIGLEVYDPPSIAPGVLDKIQAGMVLSIETPYYELGWGGVQVEDTIVVEKKGCRYLTKSSRKLIEK